MRNYWVTPFPNTLSDLSHQLLQALDGGWSNAPKSTHLDVILHFSRGEGFNIEEGLRRPSTDPTSQLSTIKPVLALSICTYSAVDTKCDQHEEEDDRPADRAR